MRKSINAKLVLAFILTLLVGGTLNIILIKNLYFDKIYDAAMKMMVTATKDIANLYEEREYNDFKEITNANPFSIYCIGIQKPDGSVEYFGHKNKKFEIPSESYDIIQKGEIYISTSKLDKIIPKEIPIIGYPFEKNNEKYSIFLYPVFANAFFEMSTMLHIGMIIIITTGITIFAIMGSVIIKRIKKLMVASRQVAKGDYSVRVDKMSNDEIGELADTFNIMVEKLGKTEKMRQEFVSNVSHEIQSPITSIMGFASLLQSDFVDEDSKKQYAKTIEDESKRLSKLSENLLKLATLDNCKKIVNKKEYSLDEQIRRVILMLEPKWSEKNIEFNLELPKTLIRADKDLLEQVWINLIGNAIKFSHYNGMICIGIRKHNNRVKVSVKDEGIGIDNVTKERIFERFYQAEESRKIEGSGLGLSISKKIINHHEGEIKVNSEIDKGSEFIVILKNRI